MTPVHVARRRRFNYLIWPTDSERPDLREAAANIENLAQVELEDPSLLSWGLKQCEVEDGFRATVDVLIGTESDLKWQYNVNDVELENCVMSQTNTKPSTKPQSIKSPRSIRAFFINTSAAPSGWLPGNFSIRPKTLQSLRKAGLSSTLLSAIWTAEGSWAKTGSQCYQKHDENDDLSSFVLWYRYTCGWDTASSFTQLIRTKDMHTYFCINYPQFALDRFKSYVEVSPKLLFRDFFLDILSATESLRGFLTIISARRDFLKAHEGKNQDGDIDFNTATRLLHRLAKNWHTLMQDTADLRAQLDLLLHSYKRYTKSMKQAGWTIDKDALTEDSFEVLQSQCDNYIRWTTVYKDRTNLQINLLFHLVNQRESRTNTSIASSTAKVAEQTQRDSASMITIAAVTMFFLPGTFISAILSTTFFDYDDEGIKVAKTWWILPAATIPLMLAVFGVWVGWQYMRFGREKETTDVNKKTDSFSLPKRGSSMVY